jgi:hypothetical protein
MGSEDFKLSDHVPEGRTPRGETQTIRAHTMDYDRILSEFCKTAKKTIYKHKTLKDIREELLEQKPFFVSGLRDLFGRLFEQDVDVDITLKYDRLGQRYIMVWTLPDIIESHLIKELDESGMVTLFGHAGSLKDEQFGVELSPVMYISDGSRGYRLYITSPDGDSIYRFAKSVGLSQHRCNRLADFLEQIDGWRDAHLELRETEYTPLII